MHVYMPLLHRRVLMSVHPTHSAYVTAATDCVGGDTAAAPVFAHCLLTWVIARVATIAMDVC